jgi:hypothetical protein
VLDKVKQIYSGRPSSRDRNGAGGRDADRVNGEAACAFIQSSIYSPFTVLSFPAFVRCRPSLSEHAKTSRRAVLIYVEYPQTTAASEVDRVAMEKRVSGRICPLLSTRSLTIAVAGRTSHVNWQRRSR